jgi:hypothetical protein
MLQQQRHARSCGSMGNKLENKIKEMEDKKLPEFEDVACTVMYPLILFLY